MEAILKISRHHFLKIFIPYHCRYQLSNQGATATVCHHHSMCKYHLPLLGICKDHRSRLDAVLFVECHIFTRGCQWWLSYRVFLQLLYLIVRVLTIQTMSQGGVWGVLILILKILCSYCIILYQLDPKSSSLS